MIKTYGPYLRKDGRVVVIHYDNETKKKTTQSYPRYLWEKTNGVIPPGYEVDHIDGDTQNNDISNLQLLTPSKNSQKYVDMGGQALRQKFSQTAKITQRKRSKLKPEDVLSIRSDQRRRCDIARHYDIHPTCVDHIKKGRRWEDL